MYLVCFSDLPIARRTKEGIVIVMTFVHVHTLTAGWWLVQHIYGCATYPVDQYTEDVISLDPPTSFNPTFYFLLPLPAVRRKGEGLTCHNNTLACHNNSEYRLSFPLSEAEV